MFPPGKPFLLFSLFGGEKADPPSLSLHRPSQRRDGSSRCTKE